MAAFDLDTPFLAWKHGAHVVKGEDCPEWEKLRMRNSIWRSLPLAMITLVLSLRNLFEIPTCQIFAMVGPLAASVVPELENDSRFIQDIHNAKLNYSAFGQVQGFRQTASRISVDQRERFLPTGRQLLALEKDVWEAAHCSDSAWEETTMLRKQDLSEHWALGYPVDLDQVELGGIGSVKIAAWNAIFFEQWVSEVERKGDEIKPVLVDTLRSFGSKLVFHTIPWGTLLRTFIHSLYDWNGNPPRITVVQSRPWKLEIGNLVNLEIKSGWKVRVLQACGLLLVAALPILKKILAACNARPGQLFFKSIVTLYVFVDLACVVMAWLLCAAAPMAYHEGAALKAAAASAGPMVMQLAQHVKTLSNEELRKHLPAAIFDVAQGTLPGLASLLKESCMPALKWDVPFFLGLAGGSLVFLAASAVLAVVLCGAHWSAGVSAGVCGPLWLWSEDDKSREHQVGSIRGLYFMMMSRSLLFAGIMMLKWKAVDSVDAFSIEIFFATICNRIIGTTQATYWWLCWVAVCAVHCLIGLAAAYAAKENLEESSETATREDYLQATYGTFDPTVWACKAGNFSEMMSWSVSRASEKMLWAPSWCFCRSRGKHVPCMSFGHEPWYLLVPILERYCPFARHILLVIFHLHHVWIISESWLFRFISDLILCPWKSFGPLPKFPRSWGFASSAPNVGEKNTRFGKEQLRTWALCQWIKKDGARSMFVGHIVYDCFTFFFRATFDVQVLRIWMFGLQSCWFEKNTSFDIANTCRDNGLAMLSSICVSLRLWCIAWRFQ